MESVSSSVQAPPPGDLSGYLNPPDDLLTWYRNAAPHELLYCDLSWLDSVIRQAGAPPLDPGSTQLITSALEWLVLRSYAYPDETLSQNMIRDLQEIVRGADEVHGYWGRMVQGLHDPFVFPPNDMHVLDQLLRIFREWNQPSRARNIEEFSRIPFRTTNLVVEDIYNRWRTEFRRYLEQIHDDNDFVAISRPPPVMQNQPDDNDAVSCSSVPDWHRLLRETPTADLLNYTQAQLLRGSIQLAQATEQSIDNTGRVFVDAAPSKLYDLVRLLELTLIRMHGSNSDSEQLMREAQAVQAALGLLKHIVSAAADDESKQLWGLELEHAQQIVQMILAFEPNEDLQSLHSLLVDRSGERPPQVNQQSDTVACMQIHWMLRDVVRDADLIALLRALGPCVERPMCAHALGEALMALYARTASSSLRSVILGSRTFASGICDHRDVLVRYRLVLLLIHKSYQADEADRVELKRTLHDRMTCEGENSPILHLLRDQQIFDGDSPLGRSVICPITFMPIQHPLYGDDGYAYEDAAIRDWISRKPSANSIFTRQPLFLSTVPQGPLRNIIEDGIPDSDEARAIQLRSTARDHLATEPRRSVAQLEEALRLGHAVAAFDLGEYYRGRDVARAKAYYRTAADRLNYPKANLRLGQIATEEEDFETAYGYFCRASGHEAEAALTVGHWILEGKALSNQRKLEIDPERALEFYLLATVNGSGEADYYAGMIYASCLDDPNAAKGHFLTAVKLDHEKRAHAHFELARFALSPDFLNMEEALNHLEAAANRNLPEAVLALSLRHVSDPNDPARACEAFDRLCKLAKDGDPLSAFIVGYCFEHGRGTGKDLQQAQLWYGRAARRGYYPGLIRQMILTTGDSPADRANRVLLEACFRNFAPRSFRNDWKKNRIFFCFSKAYTAQLPFVGPRDRVMSVERESHELAVAVARHGILPGAIAGGVSGGALGLLGFTLILETGLLVAIPPAGLFALLLTLGISLPTVGVAIGVGSGALGGWMGGYSKGRMLHILKHLPKHPVYICWMQSLSCDPDRFNAELTEALQEVISLDGLVRRAHCCDKHPILFGAVVEQAGHFYAKGPENEGVVDTRYPFMIAARQRLGLQRLLRSFDLGSEGLGQFGRVLRERMETLNAQMISHRTESLKELEVMSGVLPSIRRERGSLARQMNTMQSEDWDGAFTKYSEIRV